MGRRRRWGLAGHLVEITTRTLEGRFLLKPSTLVNLQIKGAIGRAQRRTGMRICAVAFLSNHYHLLVIPDTEEQLARFAQFVNSNIARQLNRFHGRSGTFWSHPFKAVPVSEEPEAQIARLGYVLAHSVKEDLVERPEDWPGVHCAPELISGAMRMHGIWHERTGEYRVRRSGKAEEAIRSKDFVEREVVELSPIPCWRTKSPASLRRTCNEVVRGIVRRARERRRESGKTVLGLTRVRSQSSQQCARRLKVSPLPIAHTASFEVWREMRDQYKQFVAQYQEASARLRAGLEARFPDGCFPPAMPYRPRAPAR